MGARSRFARGAAALLVVLLGAPAATAQTPPTGGADLAIALEGPSEVAAGEDFVVALTVTNRGDQTTTDAVLSLYLPAEVEATSIPDGCTTDVGTFDQPAGAPPPEGGSVEPDSPEGGGSSGAVSPAYYGGSLVCEPVSLEPGASRAVELGLTRTSARAIYLSAYAWSSAPEPTYDDNWAELFLEPDTSRPADIGVTLDAPASPEVGGSFSYTLTVTNAGPSTGTGIRAINPLPYGADIGTISPARAADACERSEQAIVCLLGDLEAGGSTAIVMEATRTSAWDVYNNAWVTSYNHDENYDNDYAWHQIAPDPSVVSDLALRWDSPVSTPLSGEVFESTLTVRNDGPSGAGDVWVNVWLPAEVRFVSATPSETCTMQPVYPYGTETTAPTGAAEDAYYPSFGGLWCSFGALAAGASTQVTLMLERTGAREAWISGWASTSNADPNYENNYFDLRLAPDKSHPADVALSFTGPNDPPVDSDFTIAAEITNNGPDVARNVMLFDQPPWGTEYVSASDGSCTFTTFTYPPTDGVERPVWEGVPQLECALGDLEPGEVRKVDITLHRTSEYELWNSGWVSTSSFDENWENDYAWLALGGKGYEGDCTPSGSAEGTGDPDGIVVGDCTVTAGEGADSIAVTPSGSEEGATVRGGAGPDTISIDVRVGAAAPRPITVFGGAGDDTIEVNLAPGTGAAQIEIDSGGGRDTVRLTIPAGLTDVTVLVRGRGDADRIEWIGSPGPYAPDGMLVFGGSGRDLVLGGPANDHVQGGRGRDRLYGGEGRDTLNGGRGSDICRGGPARDRTTDC